MPTKPAMLKLLRDTTFPKNESRKNVLKKGQTHHYSIVLGRVIMLYGRGPAQSRNNKKFPELFKYAKQFVKAHDPKFRHTSLIINKNHAAAPHKDKYNKGHSYIIGLGNYTGGELVFEDGPYKGAHNIKNKWLKFKGDHTHFVKPFKGERYTIVYYSQ
jgi:hypothetical protein|tara:strand:- start:333 stop:806 length:474 start_codon:yes stop_codon:yes gene_type:complete